MYFGTRVDEPTSFDLLDRFVDGGGRWIDTANAYSFWADPSGVGGQREGGIGRGGGAGWGRILAHGAPPPARAAPRPGERGGPLRRGYPGRRRAQPQAPRDR